MLLTYVYYEIKKKFYNKSLLATELIVSLLLIAGLFPLSNIVASETSRVSRFSVAIVDEEQSLYTQMFISQILTSPSIQNNLDVVITDKLKAEDLLLNSKIAGIIVIPAVFTENMQSGIFTPLELYLNNSMPLQSRLIEEGMKSGAYLMSTVQNALFTIYEYSEQMQISSEEVDRLFQTQMFVLTSEALDRNEIYGRESRTPWDGLTMTEYYMLSLPVLLMSLFGCGIIVGYFNDKKNNVNSRLLLIGRSHFQISCGNAVASTLTLFVQGTLIFLPLYFFGSSYLILIPMILLISLQINLFNMILAVLLGNTATACMTSVVLTLVQAFFSGSLVPVYFLPSILPEQLKFFTLHFWWHRSFVMLYTSESWGSYVTMLLIICAMIGILRGVLLKYGSTILCNT